MPSYRISEAAELIGVSDDTVRRWVEIGRLPLLPSASGPQTIDGQVLAQFALGMAQESAEERGTVVSARNRFSGIVTKLQIEGLIAQVEIQSGPHHIVSLITADAARSLNLEVGSRAVASIKATSVVVESNQP